MTSWKKEMLSLIASAYVSMAHPAPPIHMYCINLPIYFVRLFVIIIGVFQLFISLILTLLFVLKSSHLLIVSLLGLRGLLVPVYRKGKIHSYIPCSHNVHIS